MSHERPIVEEKRIAVPLPEGIIDPEAVGKALERFALAVRENRSRLRLDQGLRSRDLVEPLDSPLAI